MHTRKDPHDSKRSKLTTDVAHFGRDGCVSMWRHMCTWGVAGVWALTPPLSLATAALRLAKVVGRCFQKFACTATICICHIQVQFALHTCQCYSKQLASALLQGHANHVLHVRDHAFLHVRGRNAFAVLCLYWNTICSYVRIRFQKSTNTLKM